MTTQIHPEVTWAISLVVVLGLAGMALIVILPTFYGAGYRRTRIFGGVLLGGFGLLLLLSMAMVLRKQTLPTPGNGLIVRPMILPEIDTSVPPVSPAWLEADEYLLVANVYPSPAAAARGLGVKVAEALPALRKEGGKLVFAREKGVDHEWLALLSKVVAGRVQLGSYTVEGSDEPAIDTTPGALTILLGREVEGQDKRPAVIGDPFRKGVLTATLIGGEPRTTLRAPYEDKPWVEDFSGFVGRAGKGKVYSLAQSTSPALDAEEAMRQVRRNAADKLFPAVWQRLEVLLPLSAQTHHAAQLAEHGVRDLIALELENRAMFEDVFVQRFERPNGDVYRALALVDASPANVERIAQSFASRFRDGRNRVLSVVGSIVLLVLALSALYLFLNAATKGYYAAALRVAVVVAVVLGAGVLLLLV